MIVTRAAASGGQRPFFDSWVHWLDRAPTRAYLRSVKKLRKAVPFTYGLGGLCNSQLNREQSLTPLQVNDPTQAEHERRVGAGIAVLQHLQVGR